MATANDVLNIAASRIGYYAPNDPLPGSEAGRYVADLWASFPNATAAHAAGVLNWEGGASWLKGSSTSIWWCCLFVSMCLDMAGVRYIAGFPNYNCDNAITKINNARSKKIYVRSNKYDATPGDLVIYDWDANHTGDHIGFIRENCGTYIRTIEGNTSGSANGSQSAGNGVWPRERGWSNVKCIIHIEYGEDDDMPLTDQDYKNIAANVWQYHYASDANTDNMYNRVVALLSSGNQTNGDLNDINAKLTKVLTLVNKPSLVVEFGETFHRLYNDGAGAHAYTNDKERIDTLTNSGWKDEGVLFTPSCDPATGPMIYMMVNQMDDTLFTTSVKEAKACAAAGWATCGAIGYAGSTFPLYRLYNPYSGEHLFTTDQFEYDKLKGSGWKDEGVAFNVDVH